MNEINQFSAENEIRYLLESSKTPDQVEDASIKILSDKLYAYTLSELESEVFSQEEKSDFIATPTEKNNPKLLEENFANWQEKIANEKELEFVKTLNQQFPHGRFYLVGGCIRDGYLAKESKDYDLVIAGIAPEDLEKALQDMGKIDLVGKNFGVYKFASDNHKGLIDIALPRQEKSTGSGRKKDFEIESNYQLPIDADLSRRDLTINSMAYDLINNQLVDPFNGKGDLEHGIIKAVGNPQERFSEDLSRILRAIRFSAKFGFDIEEKTWQSLTEISPKMLIKDEKGQQIVPWETIGVELEKAFTSNPIKTLDLLNKSGLLSILLPEIDNLKGVEQPKEHHKEGDTYTHTRLALKALPTYAPTSLVFATLLHDVAKPQTSNLNENGKITFYGHAEKSAEMANVICKRLVFTKQMTEKVCALIQKHMDVFQIEKMSKSTLYKLLFKTLPNNETSGELKILNRADLLASLHSEKDCQDYFRNTVRQFQKENQTQIEPLVNGKDLISKGLKPGPTFGGILTRVFKQQIEKGVTDRLEALRLLDELIQNELAV
ncbi:MAG: Polynucleotide adenylyltransferase/metal dependent phosphohydrolase [uncultured bacterium]|nr:MAG: Polynucleotide adenylyltransferase/metal dependent phosphohydrolase [uncultured bacterium]